MKLAKIYSSKGSRDVGWFQGHQQTNGGGRDNVDTRLTPRKLWNRWNEQYGPFTLDAAASERNAKCAKFFTIVDDGLLQSWAGETVWCNPPYTDIGPWVIKARQETLIGRCRRVVMLLPANRTEQRWWQNHIEPIRDRGIGVKTHFINGRIAFGKEDDPDWSKSPPFGCVLIVFEATP